MNKTFSERMGIVNSTPTIQIEDINDDLRNSIWNLIYEQFESGHNYWISLAKWIAIHFRKVPVDDLPYRDDGCRKWVKTYFYTLSWYKVYDLIEFIVKHNETITQNPKYSRETLKEILNEIFTRELSGYRFIAGALAPISSPSEIQEISEAIEAAKQLGMVGAHQHLDASLALLGRKPDPDYRNSIKEAISAVESVAKRLAKPDSPGLKGALNELDQKVELHGALKSAFIKLYGYTSDENGIRHAILEETTVGFDEAKYMLVACSAFVNYLLSKADSSGIFAINQQN